MISAVGGDRQPAKPGQDEASLRHGRDLLDRSGVGIPGSADRTACTPQLHAHRKWFVSDVRRIAT